MLCIVLIAVGMSEANNISLLGRETVTGAPPPPSIPLPSESPADPGQVLRLQGAQASKGEALLSADKAYVDRITVAAAAKPVTRLVITGGRFPTGDLPYLITVNDMPLGEGAVSPDERNLTYVFPDEAAAPQRGSEVGYRLGESGKNQTAGVLR
ncbi:hypothetical protein [Nocardia inohanensis]|uniref:hypothetical protein n=1 Tax=Nocardia inohanensis TaxID=209246 RepID=UPI000A6820C8|nr:hypothetical protein [Nocardia inohanensis]